MRTSNRGQAAIEFAIGVFVFSLILAVLVGFAPVYLYDIAIQSEARCDAGISALGSAEGADAIGNLPDESRFVDWQGNSVSAGRLIPGGRKKDFDFTMSVGGEIILQKKGHLSEELFMPAMGGLKTVGDDR